jgi:peptidyl-dipeptidase Dcp
MPEALRSKVLAAQTFDQGYATTEYLAAALIDQAWHELALPEAQQVADPQAFEAEVLARHGMDPALVPPRYHTCYFAHVFSGGYSAGYYAYIWSEVLARDAGQWFTARGGLGRINGDTLRDKVLSRGRSLDPQAMFIDFYGRAPDVAPLVAYRGL